MNEGGGQCLFKMLRIRRTRERKFLLKFKLGERFEMLAAGMTHWEQARLDLEHAVTLLIAAEGGSLKDGPPGLGPLARLMQ